MSAYRRWCASWLAAILLGLTACGGGDHPTTTQAAVGAQGGHVVGAGGIVIDIPAGALDGNVNLQVTNAGDGHEPALPDAFIPMSSVFTITPHIEPFGVPVSVSIPVPGVADGTVVYFALARPGQDWVLRPTTVRSGMATLLTTHFSYIVIGGAGHILSSMNCIYAVGGCNPIPPPTYPIELYASENLMIAHPNWDGVLAINKPTLLTFQSYYKRPNSSCGGSIKVDLIEENWVRRGGTWALNFSHTFSHAGYDSAFVQPIPVDASMNGWLALEVTLTCEGIRTDGSHYTIWTTTYGINYDEVNIPFGNAPVITQQPQAQSVAVGQSAGFSITATGTAPLSYQWSQNGVPISGATGASYTFTNAQLANNNSTFTVTVTDGNGLSTTSGSAVLTVSAGIQIATQPQSQSVGVGQSATFSVSATGTAPLSYQWYRGGVAIAGATAASYTFANAQLADSGSTYTVTVTDGHGASVTSSGAMLTVTNPVVLTCTGSNGTGWCSAYDSTRAATAAHLQVANFTVAAVAFGSPTVGVAATQTSSPGLELLRTADGGKTWSAVTRAPFYGTGSVGVNFNDVAFANANTAVAIGTSGGLSKIWRSTDGAITWVEVASYTPPSSITSPRTPGLLQAIRFVDAQTGIISAQGSFLRTSDAGATWTLVTPNLNFSYNGGTYTQPDIRSIARIPGTTSLLAFVIDLQLSSPARLMRSADGGSTWSLFQTLSPSLSVDAVGVQRMSFANSSTGVLLDNNTSGAMYRTTDAGLTWTPVAGVAGDGVLLNADGTGVVVGNPWSGASSIAYTADFGATWVSAQSGTSGVMVTVASPSTGQFVAAGVDAIQVNTQNGVGP